MARARGVTSVVGLSFVTVRLQGEPLPDVNELSMDGFRELLRKFSLAKDFAIPASDPVLSFTRFNRVDALVVLRAPPLVTA